MHQLRRFWTLLLPLMLTTIIMVAAVPLASPAPINGDDEARDFREVMYPRLLSLAESVEAVESMVNDRSRNIVALQAHAHKIESLVRQIDNYLESTTNHSDVASVVNHYRAGRNAVLAAIAGARDALRTLDFSALPELMALFDEGSDQLDLAVSALQESRSIPNWQYTLAHATIVRS